MRKILLGMSLTLLLTGCGSISNPFAGSTANTAFDAREAAYIKTQGSSVIRGRVSLQSEDGRGRNADGEVVRLIPATGYARNRFSNLYGGSHYLPLNQYPKNLTTDPRYSEYTRQTRTDTEGGFVFDHVAPGAYIVSSQVTWILDGVTYGGSVYQNVQVNGSEPVSVAVTGH